MHVNTKNMSAPSDFYIGETSTDVAVQTGCGGGKWEPIGNLQSGEDADNPDRIKHSGPRSAAKVERAMAAARVVESSPEKAAWRPKFCKHCGSNIEYIPADVDLERRV